jgi:hypothetical protein
MKSRVFVVYLTVLVLSCGLLGAAPKEKVVVVKRPTVVAFFTPVTDAELAKDPDTNEALADFQVYAGKVRDQLAGMGIDFEEVYATSFIVKFGAKTTTFHPKKIEVGYNFVALGKSPRVEYGVMTDTDILQIASEYFRPAAK